MNRHESGGKIFPFHMDDLTTVGLSRACGMACAIRNLTCGGKFRSIPCCTCWHPWSVRLQVPQEPSLDDVVEAASGKSGCDDPRDHAFGQEDDSTGNCE